MVSRAPLQGDADQPGVRYKAWPIEPLEALDDEQGRLASEASK